MNPLALRAALAVALLLPSPAGAGSVRFENGRWWNGRAFEPGARTVVDGVFVPDPEGAPDAVVDLGGGWAVPPLADAHTHAAADTPNPPAEIADLVAAGIFFFKNPNSTLAGVARGREALAGLPVRARFSGSGFTSPGGHPSQIYEPRGGDGWLPVDSPESLARAWKRLREVRPDFVKVYLEGAEDHARVAADPAYRGRRGLDPELLPPLLDLARREGLPVSAHVRSAEDFRLAVRAGVDEINHLPLEEISAADVAACVRAGVRVVTTVLSHRPTHGVDDVSAVHRVNLERLEAAGATLALGTDNGAVNVVDELLAVERLGVFPPPRLVDLATTASIRACVARSDPPVGELVPGAEATFLVLAADPLEDTAAFRQIRSAHVKGRAIELPERKTSREGLADAMMREMHTNGLDAAIDSCRQWFRDGNASLELSEAQVNAVGYAMLRHGRAEAAVRVFQLNVALFRHSLNALDSLAEAQVAAGDATAAAATSRELLRRLPEAQDVTDAFREQLEATARERAAAAVDGD
ncbi:MAG TPA: amidohydrolase family protein [bacterium]|nr:amidohydrolase family protein [bacterium]